VKRHKITLDLIADWQSLSAAAYRAARGKRQRPDVQAFFYQYENSLNTVREALLKGRIPCGYYRSFEIRDPKRRTIRAAPFADRVAHHALMAPLVKPLDDWQVPSSFACRIGKGTHAAVAFAQKQCRRFKWYLKMDVRGYFDHINHARLIDLLCGRLRGEGLFRLIHALLQSYETAPGKGLPIGALSSQHFANLYLTPADRWLIAHPSVSAHCRYMDDTVVWCAHKTQARTLYLEYAAWLKEYWSLNLKPAIIQQVDRGLSFCGYRLHPRHLRPGRRRLRQFARRLHYWQGAFFRGEITIQTLQQNCDALQAMLQPAQSWHWRTQLLKRIQTLEL